MKAERSTDSDWASIIDIPAGNRNRRPDSNQLRNWALVLSARNIPFRLLPAERPTDLLVPESMRDIACHEIKLFLEENRNAAPPVENIFIPADNAIISISVLLLLGIFHNLTYFQVSGFGHASIDWLQLGSANNIKILNGEWWRVVTALTLHADGQHLMGNILIGGYFVVRLCQWIGSGLGWSLILASGITGNIINAFVQNAGHNSVGASTAIFGAIGIAGAIGTVQSKRQRAKRSVLPLAAAGILLAFLGAGASDSHTDIGAHLFGFISGITFGVLAGIYIEEKGLPARYGSLTFSLLSASAIATAWLLALH